MCRNIKRLRHPDHPPTDEELHDAALQFVRKISGYHKPSRANTRAFDAAVRDVAKAGRKLFSSLQSGHGAALLALFLVAALACNGRLAAPPVTDEVVGTWGGENAGLIATDSVAHVHIGCTLGDATGPIHPDAEGRFEASGTYNVDAYPVDLGIVHPAQFLGRIVGSRMTLSVVLTDTGQRLGPVTLRYGEEPRMGPCPICRDPAP